MNPEAAQYVDPMIWSKALRLNDINELFLLIVGFWKQDRSDKKFVHSLAVRVKPEQWRTL